MSLPDALWPSMYARMQADKGNSYAQNKVAFHDLDLAVESGTLEEQQTAWSNLRELVPAPATTADVAVVAAAAAIGRRAARPL